MCSLHYYRTPLPLNLIVITNGEANDEHILHWAIEYHFTKIVHRGFPAHQSGIKLVQVGDCEYAKVSSLDNYIPGDESGSQGSQTGPSYPQKTINLSGRISLALWHGSGSLSKERRLYR